MDKKEIIERDYLLIEQMASRINEDTRNQKMWHNAGVEATAADCTASMTNMLAKLANEGASSETTLARLQVFCEYNFALFFYMGYIIGRDPANVLDECHCEHDY